MSNDKNLSIIKSSNEYNMRVSNGNKTIEFSPEMSQAFFDNILNLGTQLISETSAVTIEYFREQSNIYYSQLNAYIASHAKSSEIRMRIISNLDKVTDDLLDKISNTDCEKTRECLMEVYKIANDTAERMYIGELNDTQIPQRQNLLSSLRDLFRR